jgi:hypothetical protein
MPMVTPSARLPGNEKAAPPQGGRFVVEGDHTGPPPQEASRLGYVVRLKHLHLLPTARLTPPLSGGSAHYFTYLPRQLHVLTAFLRRVTVPGEARRQKARKLRGPGVRTAADRALGERKAAAFRRPLALPGVEVAQPSLSSSPASAGATGSVGGTVTFSGVTSPGMKVMSTSSLGSPSSFALRATRIVEPGSS